MNSKKKSLGKFVGLWHITEMEMWDADYINMERQAYLKINSDGLGDFQFGLVRGQIDGEVEMSGNNERLSFTWNGNDELDPVSGSGWISLHGADKIIGKIKIHLGDSSELKGSKGELNAAQQSVQRTAGSRRLREAFFYASAFFCSLAFSYPRPPSAANASRWAANPSTKSLDDYSF